MILMNPYIENVLINYNSIPICISVWVNSKLRHILLYYVNITINSFKFLKVIGIPILTDSIAKRYQQFFLNNRIYNFFCTVNSNIEKWVNRVLCKHSYSIATFYGKNSYKGNCRSLNCLYNLSHKHFYDQCSGIGQIYKNDKTVFVSDVRRDCFRRRIIFSLWKVEACTGWCWILCLETFYCRLPSSGYGC